MVWIAIGVVITFNVVFNHVMCMLIKPGGPTDLTVSLELISLKVKKVERLRKYYKERKQRKDIKLESIPDQSGAVSFDYGGERFEGMNSEVKSLMMYRSKTTDNLKQFWGRTCSSCKEVKPARTHHCQICNRCVFRMDHHCPWVNNCLGHENLRFFLLFMLYLMLGSLWYSLTILSIWDHHIYVEYHGELSFLLILNCTLFSCLVFFNLWNWWLAAIGMSTIEFWKNATASFQDLDDAYDYKL